jgi:hypothetical protein
MQRRVVITAIVLTAFLAPATASGQAPAVAQRKFPPDSLVNVKVFDKSTPVTTVMGTMRNFTGYLGVRCQFCHVGEEGKPLEQFDFPSDDKRTKKVARVMMKMVQDINARLVDVPDRPLPVVEVTCGTCHHGVSRPLPLLDILAQAMAAGGKDSATKAYRGLRERYYGRAAYDFGEGTLNTLAGRLSRENRFDDALSMVQLNAEFFPAASSVPLTRGDVLLARRDTAGAILEYRKAFVVDGNGQARQRLTGLGVPNP